MAHLPHRRHGYFPQRRATLLPLVARLRVQLALEGIPAETGSHPATAAEEPSLPAGHESYQSCNGKSRAPSTSEKRQRQPGEDVAALLKRIRIHPEAQRILGNSCIPLVSLERLNFQSVCLSSLQPVVSLVRLPCHTHSKLHSDAFCLDQQNGVSQNEENILEIVEAESKPAESSDFSQTDPTLNSWTEPYCPDTSSSGEPEQDSGFDCEDNPDQPYILFDSGSDEWDLDARTDSETFYLDPDPEQTMVIELDPETEADQDPCLELEDEAETRLEVDVVQVETKCEADLVQVETKCEADLVQMEAKCEADLVQVETKCEADLVQVEAKCEADLVQMEAKCEADLVQVETKCEADLVQMEAKCEADLVQMEAKCEADLVQMEAKCEADLVQVEPKCEVDFIQVETKCKVDLVQVETKCETDLVEVDDIEDQKPGSYCSQKVEDLSSQQPEPGPGIEEMESEDFCAVCLNGGDLLCCDRCPKVYHQACHIPPLTSLPLGDWVCTLCRSDQEPVEIYDCENMNSCGGVKAPYALSNQDQRRCEKLTLLLYSHTLSAPFHEPVSPLARNYYQIIKRPINLSVIRRKLDKSITLHYFTAEQFVDDVLLMFKNCATFNYPDSEVAQAGRNLEVFFFSKLKEIFPERTFPSASHDTTDRARLRWLGRKRKEHHRKKRCVFSGKKYYL